MASLWDSIKKGLGDFYDSTDTGQEMHAQKRADETAKADAAYKAGMLKLEQDKAEAEKAQLARTNFIADTAQEVKNQQDPTRVIPDQSTASLLNSADLSGVATPPTFASPSGGKAPLAAVKDLLAIKQAGMAPQGQSPAVNPPATAPAPPQAPPAPIPTPSLPAGGTDGVPPLPQDHIPTGPASVPPPMGPGAPPPPAAGLTPQGFATGATQAAPQAPPPPPQAPQGPPPTAPGPAAPPSAADVIMGRMAQAGPPPTLPAGPSPDLVTGKVPMYDKAGNRVMSGAEITAKNLADNYQTFTLPNGQTVQGPKVLSDPKDVAALINGMEKQVKPPVETKPEEDAAQVLLNNPAVKARMPAKYDPSKPALGQLAPEDRMTARTNATAATSAAKETPGAQEHRDKMDNAIIASIANSNARTAEINQRNNDSTTGAEIANYNAGNGAYPTNSNDRARWAAYSQAHPEVAIKAALSPHAQVAISETEPVLKQAKQILAKLEQQPDSNAPLGNTIDAVKYKLGMGSDESPLIAETAMNNVLTAGKLAKMGGSRSYQFIQDIHQHQPNLMKDSTTLSKQKMREIVANLQNFRDDAEKYGNKNGVQTAPAITPNTSVATHRFNPITRKIEAVGGQ